jgi:CheY-like chemotaxis protein
MTPPSTDSGLHDVDGRLHLIIYVEDNPSNVALMDDLLADFASVKLLTAPTAELGLELVRAHHPDIVIMDINLPGMSGTDAMRALAASPQTRDIPVIALSAGATYRHSPRTQPGGFYRYLTKPVNLDELTQVLEGLMTDARC